jgi:hypothetical protein
LVVVVESDDADVVATSTEVSDEPDDAAVVVVVVAAEAEPVEEAAVDVVVVVVVAAEAEPVDEVVVELVELDTDVHSAEKPFASVYTFTSRPLVGTSSVQSGGSSEMMLSISDWQFVDAHMRTYSASVGRAVEYRRL